MRLVIEVGANVMMSGLAIHYMNTVLKHGAKTVRWKILLFWLLYFLAVTFLTFQNGFDGMSSFFYGLILFLYSHLTLYGKALVKILYVALWNILLTMSSSIVLFTSSIIVNRNLSEIYDISISIRAIELLSVFVLRLIFIKVMALLILQKQKEGDYDTKFILLMILICIITWINLAGLLMTEVSPVQNDRYTWVLLLFLELVLCLSFLFYLYDRWSKTEQEKMKSEHIKVMYEEQERYIRELTSSSEEIRILKHDLKKYIFVLYNYICKNEIEQCKKYLEVLKGNCSDVPTGEYDSLQAVLKNCKTICDNEGILFQYSLLGNRENIDAMDLCILSWNLLDNAVEAEKAEPVKEIHFGITNFRGYLKLECKNRIHISVLENNPHLYTTKKDRNRHGLGLASIKKIVEKYNGIQKITEEKSPSDAVEFFDVTILLQNRQFS